MVKRIWFGVTVIRPCYYEKRYFLILFSGFLWGHKNPGEKENFS